MARSVTAKPVIGVIDGGRLYDSMSAALMTRAMPILNCARGTRSLVRYIEARLYADSTRERQANI